MDLRAYWGVNNYFERIEDGYINAYPNTFDVVSRRDKSTNYLAFFYYYANRVWNWLKNLFSLMFKYIYYKKPKKYSRDYLFDKLINE